MKAFRMVGWKTPPEYREVPTPEPGPGDLRDVIALAERGLVTPKVTTYGLEQIPEAFHALETCTVQGR